MHVPMPFRPPTCSTFHPPLPQHPFQVLEGSNVTLTTGKIGSKGQKQLKKCADDTAAAAFLARQLAAKHALKDWTDAVDPTQVTSERESVMGMGGGESEREAWADIIDPAQLTRGRER